MSPSSSTYDITFTNPGPLGFSIDNQITLPYSSRCGVFISEIEPTTNVHQHHSAIGIGDSIISVNNEPLPINFTPLQFTLLIKVLGDERPLTLTCLQSGCERAPLEKGVDEIFEPILKSLITVAAAMTVKESTALLTNTAGLQPPFALSGGKALVEACENVMSDREDAFNPIFNTLFAILFADTVVQKVTDLPSPWAMEISKAVQTSLQGVDGGGGGVGEFGFAAIMSAFAMPSGLLVDPVQSSWDGDFDDEGEEKNGSTNTINTSSNPLEQLMKMDKRALVNAYAQMDNKTKVETIKKLKLLVAFAPNV